MLESEVLVFLAAVMMSICVGVGTWSLEDAKRSEEEEENGKAAPQCRDPRARAASQSAA